MKLKLIHSNTMLDALAHQFLGYQQVIDQDLKMIGTLCGESLESLDISGCINVTAVGIADIRRLCPLLHTLYIYDTDLPDSAITPFLASKDMKLRMFGPGRKISQTVISQLRHRGCEVAEATDESLFTDAVNSLCSFGLPANV